MTLKSSRKPVLAGLLCLLLLGFAGASYGAVRFDVIPSPTEVINTGRSEVLGSIHMIVKGTGNVSGSSLGGAAQIGVIYNNPALQIDNTTGYGVKLFFTSGFATAFTRTATSGNVGIVKVENIDLNGKYVGFITINLAPGATPTENDYIRLAQGGSWSNRCQRHRINPRNELLRPAAVSQRPGREPVLVGHRSCCHLV